MHIFRNLKSISSRNAKKSTLSGPIDSKTYLMCNSLSKNDSEEPSTSSAPPKPKQPKTKPLPKLVKGSLRQNAAPGLPSTAAAAKNAQQGVIARKRSSPRNYSREILEKLKQIDSLSMDQAGASDNIITATSRELDIATQQLEEIVSLLKSGIFHHLSDASAEEMLNKYKRSVVKRHRCSRDELPANRIFERMREKYLARTKVRYRSVDDFDIDYTPRSNEKAPLSPVKEANELVPLYVNPATAVRQVESETEMSVVFYDNNSVVGDNKSSPKGDPEEDVIEIPPRSKAQKNLYELVFANTPLEKEILKSDFLVKQFDVDHRKTRALHEVREEERRAKLFESTIRSKFGRGGGNSKDPSVAIKGRERKMYRTLNLALKNSLYTLPDEPLVKKIPRV